MEIIARHSERSNAGNTPQRSVPQQESRGLGRVLFTEDTFSPSSVLPEPEFAFSGSAYDVFESSGESISSATPAAPLADRAAQVLQKAQQRLGLSKSALARICGVTRQTIYDWLNEVHEPAAENLPKLDMLEALMSSRQLSHHTLSRKWTKRQLTHGLSLMDVLVREEVDLDLALNLIAEITQLIDAQRVSARAHTTARERLGWTELSDAQCERIIETSLPIGEGE